MLTGKPLDDVVHFMGKGKNYPRDLRRGLQFYGLDFANKRAKPFDDKVMQPGVVFCSLPVGERTVQHWVVWDGSRILDPGYFISQVADCLQGSFRYYEVTGIDPSRE